MDSWIRVLTKVDNMSKSVEGKVAVITGGRQGAGLGITTEFVE
jgi:hypothetical protein